MLLCTVSQDAYFMDKARGSAMVVSTDIIYLYDVVLSCSSADVSIVITICAYAFMGLFYSGVL